ncbi:hypothetical protein BYT27DRAFT_7227611 [Phlegmacium glaucopus]|nr:hypothetical protein BYT27DRAFT_7227611 [Phlegmacium glaucopus]
MASGNIAAQPTPPGHVHLVLFQQQQQQQNESFHLEIPLRVITDVCRHPPKYLRYLGWCVLGVEGSLQDGQGHQVDPNGDLVDGGQDILSHAIDLEVIMVRSQVPPETTRTRDAFHRELATRDGERCVWTSLPPGDGMRIIPWSRGDEWLQLIIGNRPHGDERRLDTLRSINDIRNRIMSTATVILKTPNSILQMGDVPQRHTRNLPNHSSYPTSLRYTLQWLANDGPHLRNFFPNNSDAAFVSSQKPKPSDLLLHYNYGAAAVSKWGRNYAVLGNRPGLPRPKAPQPVAMGPTRTIGDRTTTITKLANARAKEVQQQPANDGGSAEAIDSEQPAWDEDDVMLLFWGNCKAAMERHAKKEQEREENINKWRAGTAA